MWASIPDNLTSKYKNNVLAINTQVPAGYVVYVIEPDAAEKKGHEDADAARAEEAFKAAFANKKDVKFHPEYVETWHVRHIPGNSDVIGNNPWDKHPAFAGPEDTKVFVYIPKLVDEKKEEERQRMWAAKEKAKIDAKAAAEKTAVDGALAPGGPADPTLAANTTAPAPAPAPKAKAATKKAPAAPKAAAAEAEAVAAPKKKAPNKKKVP